MHNANKAAEQYKSTRTAGDRQLLQQFKALVDRPCLQRPDGSGLCIGWFQVARDNVSLALSEGQA